MSKPRKQSLRQAAASKTRSHIPEVARLLSGLAEEPKKQIHAYIPQSLHTRFKMKVTEDGRKMSEVLAELMEAYVQK